MRLWSLHPRYLDRQGLIALWREGLLAQAVLAGNTKGYKNHPQLDRFKSTRDPLRAIGIYLQYVVQEADQRGYAFDSDKILAKPKSKLPFLPVTTGQLKYETSHLLKKLKRRDPERYKKWSGRARMSPHPVFKMRPGRIEEWEKVV